MNKQDSNGVRTAQDIERKYDFSKMLGLSKNVELTEKGLVQIQNTLNEMLNALVINLSDVLESQSDISLWFYSGIPTSSNAPYTSWNDPSQHYGDLYYNTDEGKVYKFYELETYTSGTFVYGVHGMWDSIADTDLLRAMAITNSEIDTSTDHERKVFLQTPTPPYSSGDWWIQSDGSLYICQLGRASGSFNEQDFVPSSYYSPTIAESFDDVITVLKGTVTQLSEDCVRFTDLSTGGSTTIAGENIKTGSIESNNYVSNTSGMKINLTDGSIDTKNFKTDSTGNITAKSGTIAGFTMTSNNFSKNIFGLYNFNYFDANTLKALILNYLTKDIYTINLYDLNSSGTITGADYSILKAILNGTLTNDKRLSGKFVINSDNPKDSVQLLDSDNNAVVSIGLGGINSKILTTENIAVANLNEWDSSSFTKGAFLNKNGQMNLVTDELGQNITIHIPNSGDYEPIYTYQLPSIPGQWIKQLNLKNLSSNTYVEVGTGGTAWGITVWASDKRLKDNIEDSKENALDKIMKIKHRQFIYKNDEDKTLVKNGYVADELEEIDKEMIFEVGEDKIKHPNIKYIIPLLSKALQEQQEEIEELKKEINKLKEVKND